MLQGSATKGLFTGVYRLAAICLYYIRERVGNNLIRYTAVRASCETNKRGAIHVQLWLQHRATKYSSRGPTVPSFALFDILVRGLYAG